MIVAPRGASLGAANPLLGLHVLVGGQLAAPASAAFAVYDVSDDTKLLAPVQVFPSSGTHAVDLTADLVSDVLPVGRYAAAWTVPGGEVLGKHEIRWTVATSAGTVVVREEFDVSVGALGGGFRAYALPSDMRDEGVDAGVTDARLQRALVRATERIERVTRRFFYPREMVVTLDGNGRGALRVDYPIMALALAEYLDEMSAAEPIFLPDVQPYNRWLTQRLLSPDDRDDPRVAWLQAERPFPFRRSEPRYVLWRQGRQNVRLTGLFGYTDPDGTFTGRTPERIRECCKMLALRDLAAAWSDPETRAEVRTRHRVASETTRDQSFTLQPDRRADMAEFTGDPEIDQCLVDYMAPPFVGST